MKNLLSLKNLFFAGLMCLSTNAFAQSTSDLYQSFQNPPKEARPRVWWHWMNGNITKDGIYKDLTWMKRSGVVGFHNFDAGLSTPQIVQKRVVYMSPEWKDAFAYTVKLADSLDMEMTIASSPGWSETGGPWVKQEDGMKKLVWRHLDVVGDKEVKVALPQPFTVMGKFQDYDVADWEAPASMKTPFYKDIAFVAVRIPDKDISMEQMNPKLTTSGGTVSVEQLDNDQVNDFSTISPDKDGYVWIQFAFDKPQTIKSITLTDLKKVGNANDLARELLCSDDGINFKSICGLGYQGNLQKTYNIPTTTAKYFRIRYNNTEKDQAPCSFDISTMRLSSINQVQMAADKAGFAFYRLIMEELTPATSDAVSLNDIIDITPFVKDGVLEWKAPAGNWRIFRFGYSLTGKCNHPATKEATGLEVDKMDPTAVKEYFKNYLQTYKDASGGKLGPHGISCLLTDSYEAGAQTWTGKMMEEFKTRQGYELTKWLPALTGMIIGSSKQTERFLFDWRKTIGAMFVEYHYDLQNEILKPYGMKRYTESHENWRANLTDGMDCKRYADYPMSAFWMQYKQGKIFNSQFDADIHESASVSHIFGQNIVSAESFTANGINNGAWVYSPTVLKPTADAALAAGLNRFVIHTSPHQPVDDKIPGLGLGKYGQWFDRHQTWADYAKVWTDYLSRSCYMLQQGKFVADIAYYYGEDNNVTGLFKLRGPEIPAGYNYDYINPTVLLTKLSAQDGMLETETGMKYKVLYLDRNARFMSMPILKKIAEYAEAGVTICGTKPAYLANLNADETEFKSLVDKIWNSGLKNVTSGVPMEKVLGNIGVAPDFASGSAEKADIKYVHRSLPSGEIFWVTNLSEKNQDLKAAFRVTGKKPILWHAEDGSSEEVSYSIESDKTIVDLNLYPHDAVFVLFLDNAEKSEATVKPVIKNTIQEIGTPWHIEFQAKRGAPEDATYAKLTSFSESAIEGIKYFSGVATYSNSFSMKKKDLKAGRIVLDLGKVYDLAEIIVNGQSMGVCWHAPYTIDITSAVKKGHNDINIKVVNMWHNRLVGDTQPNVKEKITYTQMPFFTADEPLLPAGLIGPVKILSKTE